MTRGEIWLANLKPQHGTAPGKTRPVLIVQARALIAAGHPSTPIVPLTTNVVRNAYPLRVPVPVTGDLQQPSDVLIDQLRAIDNRLPVSGPLPTSLMQSVADALRKVLELDAD